MNFPMGHPLGRPLDVNFQMNILKRTLSAFTEMDEPGKIKDLQMRWSEDFSWQEWLGALVSYLDKKESKLTITEIWHDAEGKTHRRVKYKPVPGWE